MTPEAIVEYSEELARIAASGGGPKALAALLAQSCNAGVLLEDAGWHAIAAAGSAPVPGSARATVEQAAPGTAQRVMAGNQHVGWLSLFGADSARGELLLRLTAAAIGIELSRTMRDAGAQRDTFWETLLGDGFHDAAAAREEASARGIALAALYVTIALEAEGDEERPGDRNELRALAGEAFRSSGEIGFAERGIMLFVFVPAPRAVDVTNARTAAGLLPKNGIKSRPDLRVSGGIGIATPPERLQRGAETARAALAVGRRIYGGGRVVAYDELGAYSLVYEGADIERLRAFAAEVLAPLRAYDGKHQTELERTLKLYFTVGQNVKTAAEALFVHRHTVFYRLRQIAEICGRTLENPHDQLTLRLAVAIDELHNAS
ncbi:MAG: helix-turn-helix domain-containing protein [Candidatus Eremiobacteraeota bacterium]|nr:helix-turn-helix domain-containing protein [Candidatus Eremiobacteraeota bacterium]